MATPYTVPPDIGFVPIDFVRVGDPLDELSAFMLRSPAPFGIRLAGGCTDMSVAERYAMLEFLGAGLMPFTGFVSSGGTREVLANGQLNPMVTDVPALLAAQGRVLTASTVPQTDIIGLVDESRLVWRPDGLLVPNPGVHRLVVVQGSRGERLGWDGDLQVYFDLFQALVARAGWRCALVVYNGGEVTLQEIYLALALGWKVIIVAGSGRAADDIVRQAQDGIIKGPLPPPEKYIDLTYLRQAQKELGL